MFNPEIDGTYDRYLRRVKREAKEHKSELIKFIDGEFIDDEIAKFYDESLKVKYAQEFYDFVIYDITELFDIDKITGLRMLVHSVLPEMMIEDDQYAMHYSSSDWAHNIVDFALYVYKYDSM